MSGIYFHVPICKVRCSYCAFYSTTQGAKVDELVEGMCREMELRDDFLTDRVVRTIYFGGGTPSVLPAERIGHLLDEVRKRYAVCEDAEITLEANPDDLTEGYLLGLLDVGVNRLSIGVQSLNDEVLRFANRRHTAAQACEAVRMAAQLGFENISIDLMYGFPCETMVGWRETVDKALELPVQHISAYDLTYEEGTVLWRRLQAGEIVAVDDDEVNELHDVMVAKLKEKGFEQYEVSNYAQRGKHSQHNSSYWCGVAYLGIGPAAHSYDGDLVREWNVESLDAYVEAMQRGEGCSEREVLTAEDRYNEYVMLALRTVRGVDLAAMGEILGEEWARKCKVLAVKHLECGNLVLENGCVRATEMGFRLLNRISEDLMVD